MGASGTEVGRNCLAVGRLPVEHCRLTGKICTGNINVCHCLITSAMIVGFVLRGRSGSCSVRTCETTCEACSLWGKQILHAHQSCPWNLVIRLWTNYWMRCQIETQTDCQRIPVLYMDICLSSGKSWGIPTDQGIFGPFAIKLYWIDTSHALSLHCWAMCSFWTESKGCSIFPTSEL